MSVQNGYSSFVLRVAIRPSLSSGPLTFGWRTTSLTIRGSSSVRSPGSRTKPTRIGDLPKQSTARIPRNGSLGRYNRLHRQSFAYGLPMTLLQSRRSGGLIDELPARGTSVTYFWAKIPEMRISETCRNRSSQKIARLSALEKSEQSDRSDRPVRQLRASLVCPRTVWSVGQKRLPMDHRLIRPVQFMKRPSKMIMHIRIVRMTD